MMTAEQLIAFEKRVGELWEAGDLPYLIHFCGGNETELIEIFGRVRQGDWVVSTHRNHYHYLLAGGDPERLLSEIKAGRSMFIFDKSINFISDSIVAGNCAIATGLAMALKQSGSDNMVWCFVGDGAEDNGHFYEAVRFVVGHGLPCRFIIEDNNLSVDTTKLQRLGPYHRDINWPVPYVTRLRYTRTYPHAGNGTSKKIQFKPI